MPLLEAARFGDQIGHTSAWKGLLLGALAGVALALAIVAIVGTGGVAAVFIGAGIVAAGAGGALAGAHIGELIPSDPKGPIALGSWNTFVGCMGRGAARAGFDFVDCADNGIKVLAQGSHTVFVNGFRFSRKSEKAVCSAIIREGCNTVIIGGDVDTVLEIEEEIPPWVKKTLFAVMVVGTLVATAGVGLAIGWGVAIGGLVGSVGGGLGLGWVGGEVGRYFGGELGARIGEVIGGTIGSIGGGMLGGMLGGRLFGVKGVPSENISPTENVNTTQNRPGFGKNNTSDIPTQGTVSKVDGAPPVNAGSQGKHVTGHPSNTNPNKSTFAGGVDHVTETQNAWLKGSPVPNQPQARSYNTGKVIGSKGETWIKVHMSNKTGTIHGVPIFR